MKRLGCKRATWTRTTKRRWEGYCHLKKSKWGPADGLPVSLKQTVGPYHDGSAYYMCTVSKHQSYGNAYEREIKAKGLRQAKTKCMAKAHAEARRVR